VIKYITIDRSQYEIWPDFWEDVGDMIRMLTNLGYVISAKWDGGCQGDDGIFVIEFDYEDPELANHHNCWLTGEEMDILEVYRANLSD
jgi:hypothetical protein